MTLITVPTIYLADACSIIRLDGKDHNPPAVPYTASENTAIWAELEKLADAGRLKLIKQVKQELGRHDPAGLARLKQYSGQRLIIRRTAPVIALYRSIMAAHPDLMRGGSRFDPADPWLILAAEKFGYTIITEELSKAERTTQVARKRNAERIPDVCSARGLIAPVKLRDLAKNEGWIK